MTKTRKPEHLVDLPFIERWSLHAVIAIGRPGDKALLSEALKALLAEGRLIFNHSQPHTP